MVQITVKDVIEYENKNFVARYTTDDYVKLVLPIHPAASPRGRIKEHRWIMEKHLGRFLKDGEVVHHINEDPHDNRIENLQLMTLEEHISYHRNKDKEQRDNRVCYNDPTHKTKWDKSAQCWHWYFLDGDKNKPICSSCHSKEYKKIYKIKYREKYLAAKRLYAKRKRLKEKGIFFCY